MGSVRFEGASIASSLLITTCLAKICTLFVITRVSTEVEFVRYSYGSELCLPDPVAENAYCLLIAVGTRSKCGHLQYTELFVIRLHAGCIEALRLASLFL